MKHAILTALFLVLFGSTAFAATWNGHEYSYVNATTSYTWAQARAEALGAGWDLVSITSSEEMNFIKGLLSEVRDDLWIGGYQTENSAAPGSGWNWVSGEKWEYVNWRSGEPNDGSTGENNEENFLMLYTYPNTPYRFTWNDVSGTYTLKGYVMERATPVPGAAWLLGSGLIGLLGLRKRMKT